MPSTQAEAVWTVLSLLLQDRALHAVDDSALCWERPMLVLRSAHMGRMQAFLDLVRRHDPSPPLHVLSHVRDEQTLREMAGEGMTFHPYAEPGRYRLEAVPAATLDRLRAVGFGTLVVLDAGMAAEGLDAALAILAAVDEPRMAAFRADGTFARPADWAVHRRAGAAFNRLIEWYHGTMELGRG